MNTIELVDCGPVKALSIPVEPGVIVLRGRNDIGKSESLKAVSKLLGGKETVSCRQGAVAGTIEGFGVRVSLGKARTSSRGELEALSIEGNLPVADLVDPGLKDQTAADAKRIKALIYLTGATADPARFYGLLPGGKDDIEKNVAPTSLQTNDLVEMAAKIKRDLEAAARKAENDASVEEGKAAADRNAGDGLEMTAETDGAKLQKALEDAAGLKSTLDEQARTAKKTLADAEQAKASLASIRGSGSTGITTPEAQERFQRANDRLETAIKEVSLAKDEVTRLELELRAAKQVYGAALVQKESAEEAAKSSKEAIAQIATNDAMAAGWQRSIDAAADIYVPSDDDLAIAADSVARARKAIEQAAVVQAAKERIAKAKRHQEAAAELRKKADKLRDAARDTDVVLSQAVDSEHLLVRGGRLVTIHPERGEVLYCERSDGTRWRMALDEAIKRLRSLGQAEWAIIPVPQRAWSELDPDNKRAIHEYAIQQGVTILTAEATNGELRAEAYQEVEN
jgi:hypothetical protein